MQSILKRIQRREPYYNHVLWDEERKQQEVLLKNLGEYPYKDPLKKGGKSRRRQVMYDDDEQYEGDEGDYYDGEMTDERPLEGSAGGVSFADSRE